MPMHRLRRGADPAGHAAGHHLRFGWSDRPVCGGRGASPASSCIRVRRGSPTSSASS
jgi:hypothetical protein